MAKSISISKEDQIIIVQFPQKLLAYPLVYAETLNRLKKEVQNGRSVRDIVSDITGRRQMVTNDIEKTIKVLINNFGSIKGKVETVEETVLDTNLSKTSSLESIGLDQVFSEFSKYVNEQGEIDERTLSCTTIFARYAARIRIAA